MASKTISLNRLFPSYALGLGLLALCATEATAQYAAWQGKADIVMNTTADGAAVNTDVKGYPVAVILNATNFDFSQAKPNGEDIRFAAGATPLSYEIESWDATAKKAAIWVKTDVKGNDKTQAFSMYWGNSAATSESDGKKVFAVDEGWVSAWHLAEKGSTAAGAYKDATANAKNGTGVNIAGAATADGPIGSAVNLSHANKEYIVIPGSEGGVYNLNASATYSIWVNSKSQGIEYQAMFSKGEAGFRIHYYGVATWTENKGKYVVETCLDPGDQCAPPHNNPAVDVKPGTWFHLALVQSGKSEMFYMNGKLQETVGLGSVTSGGEPVDIGNNEKTAGKNERNRSHDGMLDEARVLSVAKDADWLKLDYESQKPGNKFLTIGTATIGIRQPNGSSFAVNATATLQRFDMQGRLVASIRYTGNRAEDLIALQKKSGPGLFTDKLISETGIVRTRLEAVLR